MIASGLHRPIWKHTCRRRYTATIHLRAETASNWASVANLLECFERMPDTEDACDVTDESDVASTWASTLDMLQSFRSVPALEDAHHADATSEVETERIGAAASGPITPDS